MLWHAILVGVRFVVMVGGIFAVVGMVGIVKGTSRLAKAYPRKTFFSVLGVATIFAVALVSAFRAFDGHAPPN
jgi:hypothetical protein